VKGTADLSEDEFVQLYKNAHESTLSSPSSRHIGHYKAAVKDPILVNLHTIMMSLLFKVAFAPTRWTRVTNIMLEKEENNPRCHRLRKLALFELDLNHAKCILIGRRLTHFLSDSGLLPSMQYESVHGKQR
jgi:hypothetical protein